MVSLLVFHGLWPETYPWVVAWDMVKHVPFYGLWSGMTSFELWLEIADEHEEPLSGGSGWRVLPVWVCWLWPVRMGLVGLPSSVVPDKFGSPRTLRTLFVFGNSTWHYGVWSVAWFSHMLYRLWPIGVAARHLEILNRRCRWMLTWLWPCERIGTRFPNVLYIHGGGRVKGR